MQKVGGQPSSVNHAQDHRGRGAQVSPQQPTQEPAAAAQTCNTSTKNLAQSPEEPKVLPDMSWHEPDGSQNEIVKT